MTHSPLVFRPGTCAVCHMMGTFCERSLEVSLYAIHRTVPVVHEDTFSAACGTTQQYGVLWL